MGTILVVDDEPGVLSMTKDALELLDHTVLTAGGGEEALSVEAKFPEPIDLLLTDIVMPGVPGPELAEQFGRRRPRTKVLYMSAFSLVDIAHHTIYIEPGVPILAKPFSVEALGLRVRQLLTPSPFARGPAPRPAATR
jgi:DNA-binding NtrC family response regulator